MQDIDRDKSPIKKRILQYLDFKGITKYRFYKDSDITTGILNQNNGITEDNLLKFLTYALDISIPWLITGEGEMLNIEGHIPEKPKQAIKKENEEVVKLQYECYEKSNRIIRLLDENAALRKELEEIKKATE